jgi:hypothetical protein
MRLGLACPLLIAGATMIAADADADPSALPLASRFDLAAISLHSAFATAAPDRDDLSDHFALPELDAPPMPARAPAKLRIRGKKLKLRLPLG